MSVCPTTWRFCVTWCNQIRSNMPILIRHWLNVKRRTVWAAAWWATLAGSHRDCHQRACPRSANPNHDPLAKPTHGARIASMSVRLIWCITISHCVRLSANLTQVQGQAKEQAFHLTINTIAKTEKQGADVVTPIYQRRCSLLPTTDEYLHAVAKDGENSRQAPTDAGMATQWASYMCSQIMPVMSSPWWIAWRMWASEPKMAVASNRPCQVKWWRFGSMWRWSEKYLGQALAVIEAMKIEHTINP